MNPEPIECTPLSIGKAIANHRILAMLTQDELASRAGIARGGQTISSWERGATTPRLRTLFKLARALRVPASKIIETAEKIERNNA